MLKHKFSDRNYMNSFSKVKVSAYDALQQVLNLDTPVLLSANRQIAAPILA